METAREDRATMNTLDWLVVGLYMAGMVWISWYVGRRQSSNQDYYLGGHRVGVWPIALSTMATQCSSNSLLGAPAFVIAVGGLLWLQYELAVPLAMVGIMLFLLPFFRKQQCLSVYEYLERRFGPASRTMLAVLFLFLRAFSTGVTVYGISIVIQQLVGVPFWIAVLLLGAVTILYDCLGGILADIYSDVIQLVLLYAGMAVCLVFVVDLVGGWSEIAALFPADKSRTLDFSGWGWRHGQTFTFWPMLFGGFFLYLSYYACDQSQAQRLLSSKHPDDTNLSLFLNGLLRFPLVLTYCAVGVVIGAFLIKNPSFVGAITDPSTGVPNYNLVVPVFCLRYLPHGVIGLIMAALFAAAMSSLDSTINSLSAVTIRDIVERFITRAPIAGRREFVWSRGTTVFWGALCLAFSFVVGDISPSIIESINKIGSLANGPILAAFLLATLTRRTNDRGAATGIVAGFAANLLTWKMLPGVSWLWWNVSGCAVTFVLGYATSLFFPAPQAVTGLVWERGARQQFGYRRNWPVYQAVLIGYFLLMIGILALIQQILAPSP